MARSLGTLSSFFREVGDMVEKGAVAKVRAGSQTILRDLVDNTPVDTSQALSNWIVSTGVPSNVQRNAISPGKKGSTATGSRLATIAIGNADLARQLRRSTDVVFITNNEDYIVELDEGYSPQQPPGFVDRAAALGAEAIRTERLLLRR